ncbi:branched-chain amino acid ABC transporter permease [Variovorax sp. LjRoot178]|uniref:branched-chain amino acid ABC transporter permease n=1 Tax=Variovorax sp. LjRoot178 TaxID=3342277 RepID=UPI003ECED703
MAQIQTIPQRAAAAPRTGALARPSRIHVAAALLVLGSMLLPIALPWLKTPLLFGTSFGIAALGVSVLIRAGQVSLGHAMYACLGGYCVAYGSRWFKGVDTVLLMAMGTAFAALCGLVVGSFVVRYRTIFFGMLNLALSMVLFAALGKFFHYTGGTDGLRVTRSTIFGQALERDGFETVLLYLTIALAIAVAYAVHRYYRSVAGQALSAIKTNETRLEYVGFCTYRVFLTGYVISAALCGLSGAVFAVAQGLVTPEMGYWVRSGEFVFIAILGGVVSPFGAFVGAAIFEFVKLYAAAYITGAWQLTLGIVLLAMVFFAPEGIAGLLLRSARKPEGGK